MTTSRRRQTREKVLQVLYAHELSGEPILPIMENLLSELKANRDDFEFAKALVHTVLQHSKEIDRLIKSKVMHWESERIAVSERKLRWRRNLELDSVRRRRTRSIRVHGSVSRMHIDGHGPFAFDPGDSTDVIEVRVRKPDRT